MWDERDLEEGTYHARHVTRLVAAKDTPFVDHEAVHGNPHVSITTHTGKYLGMLGNGHS